MYLIDESEIIEYIRGKLFEVDSVYLEKELITKVLDYEVDYLVENGYATIEDFTPGEE